MAQFTAKFLKEMQGSLEAMKAKIEKELAKAALSEFPDYGSKEDENAEEVATYETNKRLEETLSGELRDITKALSMIEKKTYGVCKYCKKPIAEERLRARPTSGSCVECKKTITQEA
jgi:DnaK suppressor protein